MSFSQKHTRNSQGDINFKPVNLPTVTIPDDELKPFTFDHFARAMQKLTNDFLDVYIEYAISIYCKMLGTTVPRPEDRLHFTTEYSEAYSTALEAVYIAATKVDKYDPEKGSAFKSYLYKALHDAICDILKTNGKSDFFDKTSKVTKPSKKSSSTGDVEQDEPETHSRVDIDSFRGRMDDEDETEPNDVIEKRNLRRQNHINGAFDALREYIDSLPQKDREAVYYSANGRVLRPDYDDLGRNYSKFLAKKYNTTAGYIRNIAKTRMDEAVKYAQDKGYNANSMHREMMELIINKPSEEKFDAKKIFEALTQLTPFEQFRLLHYIANKG